MGHNEIGIVESSVVVMVGIVGGIANQEELGNYAATSTCCDSSLVSKFMNEFG